MIPATVAAAFAYMNLSTGVHTPQDRWLFLSLDRLFLLLRRFTDRFAMRSYLALKCAASVERDRIDAGRRRHEQLVLAAAAEAEVGDRFRHQDLAHEMAVGGDAMHAVGR